jgi:hypothetical protein
MRKSLFPSASFNWNRAAMAVKIWIVAVACLVWQMSAGGQAADPSPNATSGEQLTVPADFQVDYTGALFGYYRIEAKEVLQPGQKAFLAPVDEFLKRRDGLPPQLLVGMGDNFGPEFGSSVQLQPLKEELRPEESDPCYLKLTKQSQEMLDKEPAKAYPQILYKDENRVLGDEQIGCDSVANFLMRAGYRAVVPGREDFLYSATWLRGIALGLRWASNPKNGASINNGDHKLLMLAANLRVTGSGAKSNGAKEADVDSAGKTGDSAKAAKQKSAKSDSGSGCPLLFGPKSMDASDLESKTTCTTGAVPVTTAMDWLSRIDATLDSKTGAEGQIIEETKRNANFDAVHAATTLQLRRTLMENQASMMLSMADGIPSEVVEQGAAAPDSDIGPGLKKIRSALKALSKDTSYLLNENDRTLDLNPQTPAATATDKSPISGYTARTLLVEGLGDVEKLKTPRGKAAEDLLKFGTAIKERFQSILTYDPLLIDQPSRRAGRRLLLRAIAKEQKDAGYTIFHNGVSGDVTSDNHGTLIIGIMGPDTMTAVSPTNLEVGPPMNFQEAKNLSGGKKDSMKGTVQAFDPLRTLLAVLRGAKQLELDACDGQPSCGREDSFDRIVVMAQMPRTLGEQLSAQLRVSLRDALQSVDDGTIVDLHQFPILILSEAQVNSYSPNTTVLYTNGKIIPVLAPDPTYDSDGSLWAPDSHAKFSFAPPKGWKAPTKLESFDTTLKNEQETHETSETLCTTNPLPATCGKESTGSLLVESLRALKAPIPGSCQGLGTYPAIASRQSNAEHVSQAQCQRDLSTELLGALRTGEGTIDRGDVVLLEQRDIYFGNLPPQYSEYAVCPYTEGEKDDKKIDVREKCKLRVDLDRVLWKGDYAERVMVSGSDLVSMLTISQKQAVADASLEPTDVSGESLATFGIVQPASPNLSNAGTGDPVYRVQQDKACGSATASVTDASQYCVNGEPIRTDGAYWVITSDHLANDKAVYSVMASTKDQSYHETEDGETKRPVFITGAIASALIGKAQRKAPNSTFEQKGEEAEWGQQLRNIVHLDIGKLVAGFSARQPNGGNIYAENFQGASDTRASTPSLEELDLESLTRVSFDFPGYPPPVWFKNQVFIPSFGIQSDAEYDRAATGNLSNKPTTVTFALNSYTVGPFMQFRLPGWAGFHGERDVATGRALPRTLLVLSPVQYQRQFTGNYLVFPFSASPPPTSPPTISGQFATHVPKVSSIFEKVGLREEYGGGKKGFKLDKGSYVEAGFELGSQYDILSSVTLTSDGITPPACKASSNITIAACFAGYASSKSATYQKGFSIDSTTVLASPVVTANLHTMGAYWDIHLQKNITWKSGAGASVAAKPGAKSGINFTLDSKSDWFAERGAGKSLNTQTRYDIPLSMSLNFPVLRNLSLSPTYSSFYYSGQVTGQSIVINSFSIAAKWYFARDASVPLRRQVYFTGPASADQTSTSKIK